MKYRLRTSYRHHPTYKPQRDEPNELKSKRYLQKRTCYKHKVDELSEMQSGFLGNDYIDEYGIDHDLWNMNMGPEPVEREDEIMNILRHFAD